MTAATAYQSVDQLDDRAYHRRIRAWTLYDWANSAFATTILAAVLPTYYSAVAGATLPSSALATSYWSIGLSVSLFVVAILSPILGTVSDVARGKKRFLAIFAGVGIVATALLVLVDTGDWALASVLAVLGRIGFNGSLTFYDALLPHVAREGDQDKVSARGYALGYLGGGLLLAINVAMIQFLPGTWGARLSFLSVAIWWAVFSIPLFRVVPEPPSATARLAPGETILSVSLTRLRETFRDLRRYGELFKFLVAFLIYNDAIGTIIGVAAIYGAELGFNTVELVLALLLVQFVGIPFSLIFGRLPDQQEKRRPLFLAFIVFNLVALPVVGILGAQLLPASLTGAPSEPYANTASSFGTGVYPVGGDEFTLVGEWQTETIPADQLGTPEDAAYTSAADATARLELPFNGQEVELVYGLGPDHGVWRVEIDGAALLNDDGAAIQIDAYSSTVRYGETEAFTADEPGEHVLALVNTGEQNPDSSGTMMSFAQVSILPPVRQSNLIGILGIILAVQVVAGVFAWLVGRSLFAGLAATLNTKRSIILSLVIYTVIAIWGFILNTTIEYWLLAWMVAIVQGGSQALSRSLFSVMSPTAKSGEFFGLFAIMEKFSSIIGPLLFAFAAGTLGSSRPAILSLILFFAVGGWLLTRVRVEEGRRVAQAEDAALLSGAT